MRPFVFLVLSKAYYSKSHGSKSATGDAILQKYNCVERPYYTLKKTPFNLRPQNAWKSRTTTDI